MTSDFYFSISITAPIFCILGLGILFRCTDPMTRALGGNYHLAAAIIAVSSLGSVVSSTLGVFLLRAYGLI